MKNRKELIVIPIQIPSEYSKKELLYSYTGLPNEQFIYCLSGITYPDKNYEVIRKKSQTFSLEYVYSGSGIIQENGNVYHVSAGDFFILHPRRYHRYYSSPEAPWKKIFFTSDFDSTFIDTLLNLYNIADKTVFKCINSDVHLNDILDLFKSNSPNIELELEKYVMCMIAELAYLSQENIESSTIAQKAKIYIDRNLNSNITVSKAAAKIGVDISYFGKIFKKEFDVSPSKYILQKKVDLAKHLLTSTSMSVNEIALQLAFTDSSHFIRTFKTITDTTPTLYRSNNKK